MLHVRWFRSFRLLALCAVLGGCLAAPAAAAPAGQGSPGSLQAQFAAAAQEFGVPESVLLSVAYNLSRWEHHDGQPSTGAGYGVMHLTELTAIDEDAKGDETARPTRTLDQPAGLHTLGKAAALLGQSADTLKSDRYQNIRGGATLLAQYAREATGGSLPTDEAGWYDAVARYSGSPHPAVARDFANTVFATIREGVTRTTTSGETVTLAAHDVALSAPQAAAGDEPLPTTDTPPECPPGLTCHYIPAAYTLDNPADPSDYGNYDLADRPGNGLAVRYIVIHDTETSYAEAINIFENPTSYVTAHYVIRAADGDITQMVRTKDVAYQAGNWFVNTHSIGVEHEGVAIEGASWYSEPMYRASARLVRYLALKYGIPLDRGHIVGHDDVPGVRPRGQTTQHWDPGPFWDWAHYMELLGAPIVRFPELRDRPIVTIRPNFESNLQHVTGCNPMPCRDLGRQPVNFVYLYTEPRLDAPLFGDPALNTPGTTNAEDWGDKASTGQQFYRAERRGDWSAIYYAGSKVWFLDPRNAPTTVPSAGTLVTPKPGKAPVTVYGTGYPDPAEFPSGVPVRARTPLQYTIPAGQAYVVADLVASDYYYAPVYTLDPSSNRVIRGGEKYYQIYFNHRFAFVKASDMDAIYVR